MTIIGYIILPIVSSIFLYSLYDVNNKKLLQLCIFFIPFSGLSLYNNVEVSFYILPFTLCAVLWIVLQLIKPFISSSNISLDTSNSFIIFSLIFFTCVSLSSLSPIFINGSDFYYGANEDSARVFQIQPSTIYILQLIYIFIGVFFSIFIVGALKTLLDIELVIKTLIIGSFVACLIGLFEIISFYLGYDLWTGFYHTVPTGSGNLAEKGVRLDGLLNIARINSVSYETSNFAQHILVVYAFMFYSIKKQVPIFSQFYDKCLFLILLISLLLALSTTALIGIIIIHFVYWIFNKPSLIQFFKSIVAITFLFLVFFLMYKNFENFAVIIDVFVLNKFSSGSAESRLDVAFNAFEVFLRHPIIGVGFGVLPASDLIITILVGTGLIGFISFFIILTIIFYNSLFAKVTKIFFNKTNESKFRIINRISDLLNALIFSYLNLLIIYQSIGFTFRFGDFWAISGIIVATYILKEKTIREIS